jgi:hypothetical protein
MGLVEDFIIRYRREYDFYDQAARLAAQMLDGRLQAAGVRSMVTSRAKSVTRLGPKVTDRAVRKAAVHDVNFLLTWNCTHLANAVMRDHIEAVCRESGFRPPIICTPEQLALEEET